MYGTTNVCVCVSWKGRWVQCATSPSVSRITPGAMRTTCSFAGCRNCWKGERRKCRPQVSASDHIFLLPPLPQEPDSLHLFLHLFLRVLWDGEGGSKWSIDKLKGKRVKYGDMDCFNQWNSLDFLQETSHYINGALLTVSPSSCLPSHFVCPPLPLWFYTCGVVAFFFLPLPLLLFVWPPRCSTRPANPPQDQLEPSLILWTSR